MSNFNFLNTEGNYWRSVIDPLIAGSTLIWEVKVDLLGNTIILSLLHPNHKAALVKTPEFLSKIDVDSRKRSREIIIEEIKKVVAEKLAV